MKIEEICYMAGFMDGEGTITANYRKSERGFPSLHFRAIIFNTNLNILERLKVTWGGRLSLFQAPRSIKHKKMYCLYWGGKDCLPVLEAIIPYLVIKKRQAEIVLDMSKLTHHYEKGHFGRIVSPEVQKARECLGEEIKQLNHRGAL